MGIKESNLPIAESLASGDKLRIVTAEGKSEQIDANVILALLPKIYRLVGEQQAIVPASACFPEFDDDEIPAYIEGLQVTFNENAETIISEASVGDKIIMHFGDKDTTYTIGKIEGGYLRNDTDYYKDTMAIGNFDFEAGTMNVEGGVCIPDDIPHEEASSYAFSVTIVHYA